MSVRSLVAVSSAALLGLLPACGGEECGDGTTEVNGVCIATSDGSGSGNDNSGNANDNDNDNDNGNADACGAGTELVGDECVPVATLAGFTVTTTPVDCDAIVDGVVPVATTVTAVEGSGSTLTSFTGDVTLVGLGGVTVSPSTLSLTGGTGTVNVTVNGVSEAAEVVAFNSTGSVSGRSAVFEVVSEVVEVASITAPTTPVRSGETIEVSVELETNACRAPMDPSGNVFLSAEGAGLSPSTLPVNGMTPVTGMIGVTANLESSSELTLTAQLGVQSEATTPLTVVPPLAFAGVRDARIVDSTTAIVSWTEATGGSGGYVYTLYRSTALGTLGDPLSPTSSEGTLSASVSVADGADGDVFYFAVRVTDSLGGAIDTNLVQASVRKGAVVYVDSTNAGVADGGPGSPFTSVAAALGALTTGGSIYVSAATYQELPLDFSSTEGIQLLGGFSGFIDSSTTAAEWTRGSATTSLTFTGVNPSATPLLQAGANAVLSQVDIGSAVTTADVLISATNGLEVRNSTVGSAAEGSGTGTKISATGDTTISGSTVSGVTGSAACVLVQDGALTVAGSVIDGCNTGLDASVSSLAAIPVVVTGATFRNSSTAIRVSAGTLTVAASSFSDLDTAFDTTDTDIDLDAVVLDNVNQASTFNGVGGAIVTNSTMTSVNFGFEGSLSSVAGERRPLVFRNNRFETDNGDSIRFDTNTPGVFDLEVVNNELTSASDGYSYAMYFNMRNTESNLAGSVRVTGNTTSNFNYGVAISVDEGGTIDESLVATISDNYVRGERYGQGVQARLYSSGSIENTVTNNQIQGFRYGVGLNLRSTSQATQTGLVAQNRSEGAAGGATYGIRVVSSNTDLAELGTVTVRDNIVSSDQSSNYSSGLTIESSGGLSTSVRDNEAIGRSYVQTEAAGFLSVTDNIIAGNRASIAIRSQSANDGAIIEPRIVTVSGNTVSTNSGVLQIDLSTNNDRSLEGMISNNIFESTRVGYSSAMEVELRNNGGDGDVLANVVDNELQGVLSTYIGGTASGSTGSFDMNIENNAIDAAYTAGVSTFARPRENDLDLSVVGNSILARYAGIATTVDQDNSASVARVENNKNLILAGQGISLRHRDAAAGTEFRGIVRNNVILNPSAANSSANAIEIDESSANSAISQIDVLHNTMEGNFSSGAILVSSRYSRDSVINLIDNVIADTVTNTTFETNSGSEPASVTQNNNLVRTGQGGVDDVEGDAQFVNPVERFVAFTVSDAMSNEIEVIDGSLAVGDRLAIAGGMLVYTVTTVAGPVAMLAGEALPITDDILLSFVWSDGNFVSAMPDYNLQAGTPGSGAATDTGDIGAFGGMDPFVAPTP